MTHKTYRLPLLALGFTVVFMTSAAWSQSQNQYDEQRRDRYAPGNEQYDDRYDNRSSNQRDAQADTRGQRRDDQFNDREDGRQTTYNDDDSRADRRQERRAERNEEDGPAGLGVMLDSSDGTIEVREVARRSPAARAGIEQGDQIIAVNGRQISSPEQLTQLIRQEEPGSQVDIRIRRDGRQQTVTAELESMREALDSLERGRFDRWQDEEQYYSNSPPWSDDELMDHVDQLEQQVRAIQDHIDDLRKMLDTDPSQQRFSQRNERQAGFRD